MKLHGEWLLQYGISILLYCMLGMFRSAEAGREIDSNIYCGACRALINEVEYAISQEDPRQMITVGSFRIDPNGKQKHTKIPYAGSEAHLTEVVESICEKMTDYAEKLNPETQEKSYVRYNSRNGEDIELEHVSINASTGKFLQVACDNILEEHEEDLMRSFKEGSEDVETRFCSTVTSECETSGV
ncbi:protein canopy homolog 2-like [Diadema antillarum]|uniref:protein canopy homolog 2-like n=1 Tax=Diadema antillarum TaxID=105358 RepID=UPI003A83CBBD